jgi:hypothetical protein
MVIQENEEFLKELEDQIDCLHYKILYNNQGHIQELGVVTSQGMKWIPE